MGKKDSDEVRCESCNSLQIYTRIKTQERVCSHCGHIQMLKKGEINNGG